MKHLWKESQQQQTITKPMITIQTVMIVVTEEFISEAGLKVASTLSMKP